MATKIEWTDETWSPVTGCTEISEGCAHCWAKRMAQRLAGRYGYPKDEPFRITFHPDRLDKPMDWVRSRKIFAVSMGDLFHEKVEPLWIALILGKIRIYNKHTFMILTKRPNNLIKHLDNTMISQFFDPPLPNLWLGVTAENQKRADERIPTLLQIPAAVRFVSVEPMLGPIDLTRNYEPSGMKNVGAPPEFHYINALTGYRFTLDHKLHGAGTRQFKTIDWAIVGGETGPGARPMHPDWVRSLRDQCDAGTPFFFKQWGDWAEYSTQSGAADPKWVPETQWLDSRERKYVTPEGHIDGVSRYGSAHMVRVGKKKAGRLLDGRMWDQCPQQVQP
jgi:protein gp37